MSKVYTRVAAYHWYLGSAFWRERREFILQRAGHTCEKCGKRRATGYITSLEGTGLSYILRNDAYI